MARLDFPAGYPEALQLIALAVYSSLSARKTEHQAAAEAAFAASESVRQQIGGAKIYIPKGEYYEADRRADEIYQRFNGRNSASLAREYDLSEERIRQICAERMLAERAARQGNLPL